MPRDAAATRERILVAATEEFATHGISGARVDRIAEAAKANKAQLYAYFGSKGDLFDVVYARAVDAFLTQHPLGVADLPASAVDLYDAWLKHPEIVRLQAWARLERRPDGQLLDDATAARAYRLDEIRAEQKAGAVRDDLRPVDVVSLVLATSLAWSPVSQTTAASLDDRPAEHRRRRKALRAAVAAMLAPPT